MAMDRNEFLKRQLKALEAMDAPALQAKFLELYGFETKSFRLETLRRRIAYRLQEFHLGGLSAEDEAFLDGLADNDDLARLVNVPAAKPRKSAGTRYVREWHGRVYEVVLREKGKYELDGVFYTSLSAAAFAITGTHWNGKLFFGVKKP